MLQPTRNARLSVIAAILLGGIAAGELYGQDSGKEPKRKKADPTARSVLEKVANFHQQVKTLQVNLDIALAMKIEGLDQTQETHYEVQYKRPRLFTLKAESGQGSPTIVSDGEQVFTYYPSLKQYISREVSEDEPINFAAMGGTGAGGMAGAAFMLAIPNGQLVEQLMQGVEQSEYAGKEEVDGVSCHHLKFTQEQFEWQLWVQAEEQPLPRRLEFDMSKLLAQARAGDEPSEQTSDNAQMRVTATFDDWKVDASIPDEEFQFTPPDGAEQVESLFEAMAETDEGPHPLVGEKAPSFTLEALDDSQVELKQHRGEVVMLDFWATWCPPCVEGLPKVSKAASELKDEGVVFYAVNVGEDVEAVEKFLADQELEIPVLMDQDAAVAEAYHANAIPQTVLIGKDGTVQTVHVGLSRNMEEELRQQLQALVEGKDLATEQLEESEQLEETAETRPEPAEVDSRGLDSVWSVDGRFAAVATDQNRRTIYAASPGGDCVRLDAQGNEQSKMKLDARLSTLRATNLAGDEAAELLGFTGWGRSVTAHTPEGNSLWNYSLGQGVDDVWPHDLDGDGLSEVIIGYNGSTGLHVLDNRGELLWKNTELGNVWHVTAGDVHGDSEPEVVSTSARGLVHLFSADGDKIEELPASCYANMVRIAEGAPLSDPQIIVGGSAEAGEVLLGMDAQGQELWNVTLAAGDGHIDSALAAPGTPWIAVGMRGGIVHVVDIQQEAIIASRPGQGSTPQVGWLRPDSQTPPLLLVATGRQLNAFRVLETTEEATPADDEAGASGEQTSRD